MKHTIKSIILLVAILIGGAGQAWASINGEPNLGKIVYTTNHGSLASYQEETCIYPVNTNDNRLYSAGLTQVKDESDETVIGYKVYIKATPDFGYTLGAADNEGKVGFITAEVTVAGSDVAGARNRGAAVTVNVGDFIDVTATATEGVYCVTMPADKNLNLHITATFPERPYLTGVSYIDPTKTGNAQNATTPAGTHVYILDGTETVLGEDGKEMWYVCKTPASANSGAGLMYDHLTLNGDVRLILADDSKMSVESANSSAIINGGRCSLGLYGQSTGTSRGALIAKSTASDQHAIKIYGSFIISHCKVTAEGPLGMRSDGDFTISNADVTVTGNSGRAIYISTGNVSITGGKVTAEGSSGIEAPSGAITISNADVTATGTLISAISAGSTGTPVNDKDITITGGKVIATGYEYGIKASGDITISGGQVKAITTNGDNSSYGIYSHSGDIVLGWANATDFIYADKGGRVAKTADGQRFIACIAGATESDPMTATALISGTSGTDFELSAIEGKMLKPCDGNFVKLTEGVTASATDGESITIGTETLYKVANGVEVTLSATDSDNKKLSSVTLSTGTVTDNSDNTFTFTMGTSDVTVTAATFLEKVSYYDPTAEGDNKTKTVFATPLTGNETTLVPGWYVVNEDIDYTTVHTDKIVLSATGNVNLILADGKKMNIGSAESPVSANGIKFSTAATLAIYGQGGTTEGSLSIYTADNMNPIERASGITIYGGNLTVNYRLLTDGTFTIHGGTFNDTRTNSSNATAINAAEINIRGGKVESEVSELYTNDKGTGNINISGGVVNVRCLNTSKGSIDISGGQVTIGANGISSKKDLTLSWTDAKSDFIASGGTFKSEGGSISIAQGKHFLAYNSEKAIVAVYDAQTLPDYDSSNFYSFDGKTLKPALEITLPEGITATGTDVFTSASETAGTYALAGTTVTLDGTNYTPSEGFTVKDADGNDVNGMSNEFTMPATDVTVTISATAPTITAQPSDLPSDLAKLEWGDTSGNELSIEVQEVEVHTLSYQWYSNSTNSNTDGTAIDGATSASYAVSTERTGTFYYYCIVTATRNDNNETASVSSDVATVTVSPKSYDLSTNTISCAITQDENGYSVHLTEGEGSANQLSISGTVADLDYSRTLTAPTESNKDVTIGNESANLYTVCLPFTPDTGTGVTYYTLSKVEGTTLSFVEISGSPVAFTPYLVAVTGNNNFTEDCSNVNFETTATIHSTPVDGYTFTGTLTGLKNTDAQGKYILQADNKWGKVTSENGDARIPPFRAYIEGPANGARLLNSSFDGDATGIQNIRTVDADGTEQWYDLNGRRIAKPTTKGVYIRNGKKTTN